MKSMTYIYSNLFTLDVYGSTLNAKSQALFEFIFSWGIKHLQ